MSDCDLCHVLYTSQCTHIVLKGEGPRPSECPGGYVGTFLFVTVLVLPELWEQVGMVWTEGVVMDGAEAERRLGRCVVNGVGHRSKSEE